MRLPPTTAALWPFAATFQFLLERPVLARASLTNRSFRTGLRVEGFHADRSIPTTDQLSPRKLPGKTPRAAPTTAAAPLRGGPAAARRRRARRQRARRAPPDAGGQAAEGHGHGRV